MAFDFNLDTTIKELYEQGQISVRTFNCLAPPFTRQLRQLYRQTSAVHDRTAELRIVFWIQYMKMNNERSLFTLFIACET